SLRELADCLLELTVLEGDHAAAIAADRMVVVMAVGLDPLVASSAAADLDPLHQPQLLELLQGSIHTRPAAAQAAAAQLVVEIESRDHAVVLGERLDDRRAGPPTPVAVGLQGGERILGPSSVGDGAHLKRS